MRYRVGEGITGQVVQTGKPMVVPRVSREPAFLNRAAERPELRSFVYVQQILDFGDLQPAGKATAVIRETASRLGLTPDKGVQVRLTGSVVMSDDEFASIADGAAWAGPVSARAAMIATSRITAAISNG